MTGSASFTPLLFVLVIVLVLMWQVLGSIGAEYYLLHWLGKPWRRAPVKAEPPTAHPEALMTWADDGGRS